MSILKIARMGNPVLRRVGRELSVDEIRSSETARLVRDMTETMHEYGGIGLAAPQVHESIQLALLELSRANARYPGMAEQPLIVVVNPRVTVLDSKLQGYWEGCLSVPELRGLVHRPRKIRVDYLDLQGSPQSVEAEGFLATVFQHELDHLAGKLFLDRMRDTTKLAFLGEYERYWFPEIRKARENGRPDDDCEGELGD